MNKQWTRCEAEHCGRPAISSLEVRHFCLDHFILHCYKRLDLCAGTPYADADEVTSVSNDRFLRECIEQSAELVRPIRGFDNLDRARLFDIFLWASELAAKHGVFRPGRFAEASTSD